MRKKGIDTMIKSEAYTITRKDEWIVEISHNFTKDVLRVTVERLPELRNLLCDAAAHPIIAKPPGRAD
jgi:hypothetical protein